MAALHWTRLVVICCCDLTALTCALDEVVCCVNASYKSVSHVYVLNAACTLNASLLIL